jgi:YD repeat-containing protein
MGARTTGMAYAAVRQTGIGGYTYVYDDQNRITTAVLSNLTSVGFTYDGSGQRVQKITCPAGSNPCTASVANAKVTSTYLYDAAGNLASEIDGGGGSPAASCGTATCFVSVDQVGSSKHHINPSGKAANAGA